MGELSATASLSATSRVLPRNSPETAPNARPSHPMRERGVGHRDHDLLVAGGSEPLTTAEEEPGHLTKLAHDGRPWVALLGRPLTQGIHVGRKRVARLMRAAGVRGVSRRKWVTTTTRDPEARAAPDLVQRDFHVDGPDRLWVAAITYVPTGAGFLDLAAVLDAWSRRVIGWAMATHLRTELVLAALDMALAQRQPHDVIHHSDHGCQYTAVAYGQRCRALRRPAVDGIGRRRLRQRPVRELLRDARVRVARPRRTSGRRPRRAGRCSTTSKAGTTRGGATPRSATSRPSPTSGFMPPRPDRAPAPEKARAVQPPGATLTEGGAISLSPQTGPTTRSHAPW